MWSVVEARVNKTAHNTVGDLKAAIVEEIEEMDRRALVRTCSSFRPCLEQFIKAEGGFIK